VEDAREDPRFADNRLVTGPEGIRFYAGAPILDVAGRALGTLCILDTRPRHLSPAEIETLCDLAFGVSAILRMEQANAARRESEEHHRWAVALSPQSQWVADAQGNILEVGPQMLEQLGMRLSEVRGYGWIRGVPPEERAVAERAWRHSLRTGERFDLEFHFRMADNSRRWVRSRAAPRRDEAGQIIRWYGTIEDIDDRKQVELAVEEARRRLETVLESTTDLVAFFDHDWRATYLNPGLQAMADYSSLQDKTLWDALPDLQETTVEHNLRLAQEKGAPTRCEWYSKHMKAWISIHAYPTPQGVSVFMRNITEQHQLRERLLHQAQHDPLTGLPNSTFFYDALQRRVAARLEGGPGQALLRLRLDGFRAATDTFGPAMGDALMRCIVRRLHRFVESGCFMARLDGPELAVLDSIPSKCGTPEALARKLLDVLQQPYTMHGSTILLKPSIGIALAPEDANEAKQLLQAADIAMSRARTDGQVGFRRFTAGMQRGLEERHRLLLDLRDATAHRELSLAYQPLVDLPQGRVGGFEALMRWRHPERGSVPPAEFIPVAEQSGLMVEIGAWALRQACEDAKNWLNPVKVAVNLSPVQFRDPTLVQTVARTLEETGFPASRLKLEITEAVLLEDSEANLGILHQLRKLGVLIVLDDFGTGYSSLGYLQRFPFHKLKVDQSFVRPLIERPESQAIVRSILDLARTLNIDTTAEGIETEEQLRWLVREGCGQAQGYLLGRPMPVEEVNGFLQGFVCPPLR
jgi:diguanylate cyclase (GGDEF)-like protein/PAS domain S-box-containing protein